MTNATLAARLAALANEAPEYKDGARLIPTPDAFDTILAEIDQTVLPTTLAFTSNDATLTLVVAARRLCAVPGVVDELAPDDTAAIKAAADAIATFAEAATSPLELRDSEAPDQMGDATHRVSAAALVNAAGRVVIDPDAPFVEKVRLRLGDTAQAWVIFDGTKITDGQGPKPLREILNKAARNQVVVFQDKRRTSCPSHSEPSLTILAGSAGDGITIGLVSTTDEHLLLAMSEADIAAAVTAFQLTL